MLQKELSDYSRFPCPSCDREFSSKKGLSIHETKIHDPIVIDESELVHDCPSCDQAFPTEHGLKVHHATVHDESLVSVEFDCEWCGRTQERIQSQFNEDMHNFCDEACAGKFRSEHYKGEDHPMWTEDVRLTCNQCGDEYTRTPSESDISSFCSYECKGEWQSEHATGEDHPWWNGGLVTLSCNQCGDEFEVKRKREDTARFCSYDCWHVWQSENVYGPDHPSWRGGRSIYRSVKHSLGPLSWTTIARECRGDECEKCGATENLHLHHIVPILCGGTNGEYNHLTLCGSCHRTAEVYTRRIIDPVLTE